MTWWIVCAYLLLGWRGLGMVAVAAVVRRARRAGPRPPGPADMVGVARILAVAMAGGANLVGGFELASQLATPGLRPEIGGLLRRARTQGMAVALASSTGRLSPLATRLARAQLTGALLGPVLDTFIATTEEEERARVLERIRTLPVRLMIPLALLLLPGFVLVVVAPGVVETLGGLLEGLRR
jgi:Type II secretion system (T2SS), protein F